MYDNLRFEYAHFNSLDFGSYGLGASVTPMGSQLMTTNTAINWGLQNLEVNLGTQMSFQQAGHLAQLGKIEREELIRLAKLNKVNLSVHAPLLCPAGGQGNAISEIARVKAVQEFEQTLDFVDQIGRSMNKKHVPVVIHAVNAVPGNPMPDKYMYVIDRERGEIVPIEAKEVAYDKSYLEGMGLKEGVDFKPIPGKPGHYELLPQGRLKMYNKRMVDNLRYQEAHTAYWRKHYEEQLKAVGIQLAELERNPKKVEKELIDKGRLDLLEVARMYRAIKEEEEQHKAEMRHLLRKYTDEKGNLRILDSPDNVAKEQIKKTFVELGLKAYEKKSQPMIVIENFYPEHALSNPEKLAEAVKEIRQSLAEELVRKKGLSRDAARKVANELIGITLDIGHLNLFKKYINPKTGKLYSDKEILEWVKKVYPYIKHVHITDNFGDIDAHLPIGWGTAPIKEAIEILRKKGWKGRAILETFGAIPYGQQAFGVAQSLYQMGVPLVPGGPSWDMAFGTYFQTGYAFTTGPILPDVNFQTYGVGFSGLPYATGAQIGGQKPGERFAGTPMS